MSDNQSIDQLGSIMIQVRPERQMLLFSAECNQSMDSFAIQMQQRKQRLASCGLTCGLFKVIIDGMILAEYKDLSEDFWSSVTGKDDDQFWSRGRPPGGRRGGRRPRGWLCWTCDEVQFAQRRACRNCRKPRPAGFESVDIRDR